MPKPAICAAALLKALHIVHTTMFFMISLNIWLGHFMNHRIQVRLQIMQLCLWEWRISLPVAAAWLGDLFCYMFAMFSAQIFFQQNHMETLESIFFFVLIFLRSDILMYSFACSSFIRWEADFSFLVVYTVTEEFLTYVEIKFPF